MMLYAANYTPQGDPDQGTYFEIFSTFRKAFLWAVQLILEEDENEEYFWATEYKVRYECGIIAREFWNHVRSGGLEDELLAKIDGDDCYVDYEDLYEAAIAAEISKYLSGRHLVALKNRYLDNSRNNLKRGDLTVFFRTTTLDPEP